MGAGNMQRLTAQVIAHPCHNALVLQQSHEAAPVQLVMGVEGQPVTETCQDCLAPRSNLADRLALQVACIGFQMVKGEE